MERGEVWWASIGEKVPVVLLSGDGSSGFRAMQIVPPATADEKQGFLVLTGEEATDPQVVQRTIASQAAYRATGIEVKLGAGEGLPIDGVVRVAFPRDGQIYCTWLVTVAPDILMEKAGELSSPKLDELANALHLAGVE